MASARGAAPVAGRHGLLRFALYLGLCLAPCLALPAPALAASLVPVGLKAEYTLTLAGIPLAEFKISGNFDGPVYEIGGTGDSLALVSIIASFKGHTKSEGRIDGAQIRPDSYLLDLQVSDKRQTVSIAFDRGKVKKLAVEPKIPLTASRIPLKDEHHKGVLDPVSAVVIPLPEGPLTGENACERILPIFDGNYRYDMKLTYKRTESLPVAGAPRQRTDVYVCKIKYLPIAGHRPDRQSTIFWATNEDMELWLTPLRSARILIPYRLVMPTPFGVAVANVSKLSLFAGQQRASAQ